MARDGYGTTITFGTSGFTASIIDVDGPAMVRNSIDATTMTSGTAMAYIPAANYDVGETNITFEFNGTDNPPISGVIESITIDWAGQGAGKRYVASGFMTNYKPEASIGARMQATATLKHTGAFAIS